MLKNKLEVVIFEIIWIAARPQRFCVALVENGNDRTELMHTKSTERFMKYNFKLMSKFSTKKLIILKKTA